MDNLQNTLIENSQSGNAQLPFHAFFGLLKNNGFSVTAQQIIDANKVIIYYSDRLKNEEELFLYLLPIFTGNEDEQLLFKQLFLKHFRSYNTPVLTPQTKKELLVKKVKKHWKRILVVYGLVALILVSIIIIIFQNFTRPDPSKITVTLVNPGVAKLSAQNNFSAIPNQPIVFNAVCLYENQKDHFGFTCNIKFKWGDGTATDDKNSHTYKTQGKFDLTAFVQVIYNGKIIKYDTIHSLVLVCAENNILKIDYGPETRIPIKKGIVLKASVSSSNKPDYIKWSDEGRDLLFSDTYVLTLVRPGTYQISCIAVYDSINSPCSMRQDVIFDAFDPELAKANPQKIKDSATNIIKSKLPKPVKKTSSFLFYLYIALAIIFVVLAIFFLVLSERERIQTGNLKKSILDKYTKLVASFSGKKTPVVIPFKNKNYIPVHQSEIKLAARQMRKRVNDNGKSLHIGKTINRSIENGGLFQPVLLPRTKQTEYLVLIDETNSNSQLVKIFEYLAEELKKQNILIEQYYYRTDPKLCYRFNETGNISIEKLFTRYENHVLLIFGDAHQLINNAHHAFDEQYLALISQWQYKTILTPVSYTDWGTKEKDLIHNIPVFPLDMEGLLLMTEYLADNENNSDIISRLNQHRSLFYKVDGLNFEMIEEIKMYCNNAKWAIKKIDGKQINILFQWIAALAVYPKISWEVTITIGKSILDKYNCVTELNFTNLLRITRISWMKEGIFPDKIRLELLKELNPENEVLARETLLILFKEIPDNEIKEISQVYEEKEIQQIINEFSLYANDPVFYSTYRQSKGIFEKLWNEKKLNDAVTELYFNNADKKWKTTINITATDNTVKNVGIEEYFDTNEKEDTLLSKLYLWLCLISLFVFITSLFALIILYKWKTGTDRDPNELAYMRKMLSNIL